MNSQIKLLPKQDTKARIPFWFSQDPEPETVVYSSRKQFLRQADHKQQLLDVNDAQLDRYYKEFLFAIFFNHDGR